MMKREQAGGVKLLGGDWSLDFANAQGDWEANYTQLLDWSRQAGLVSEQEARVLAGKAEEFPQEAQDTVERAQALSGTIHGIFWAIATGLQVQTSDLAALNRQIALVLGKLRMVQVADEFQWGWDEQDEGLDRILWPVVHAAAELLQAPNLRWLKACDGEYCDRLFLDLSRNHSRRWCEMQHCGMRVKSRRHYAKKRQALRIGA